MIRGAGDLQLVSIVMGYLATATRAVCIADSNSNVVYANPVMAELFSAPTYADIVGKNICDFIEEGVDHPHRENARVWMDRIKGDFKTSGLVKCRNYNGDLIDVIVQNRRFFLVQKIGGGEELYMGCTVAMGDGPSSL